VSATWGIHPLRPSVDFLLEDRIVLERPGVGDLRKVGDDPAALLGKLRSAYPRKSEDTLADWAATLRRFAFEAQPGDLVVYPEPQSRRLSFGRIVGEYAWTRGDPSDQHVRRMDWRRTGIPTEQFSAGAQKSVGGRAAFFGINEDAATEFQGYVAAARGRR
jgi:predicted Mrr-cat superfamily restriction endonuclease